MGQPFRIKNESPNETASYNQNLNSDSNHFSGVATGSSDDRTMVSNDMGEGTIYVTDVGFRCENGTYAESLEIQVYAKNAANETFYRTYGNPATFPNVHYDPAIPIEEGGILKMQIENDSGSTIDYGFSVNWRTE